MKRNMKMDEADKNPNFVCELCVWTETFIFLCYLLHVGTIFGRLYRLLSNCLKTYQFLKVIKFYKRLT